VGVSPLVLCAAGRLLAVVGLGQVEDQVPVAVPAIRAGIVIRSRRMVAVRALV
jgi:hypothetical protein